MLNSDTKQKIDNLRDVLVGKVPDPKGQVEQITLALFYKFMDDMDVKSVNIGGVPSFFTGKSKPYSWHKIIKEQSAAERIKLYIQGLEHLYENPNMPRMFRELFKNASLPYKDAATFRIFSDGINEFDYTHSEQLGDAYEYLLSIMSSQGDAGQFRTPRHIIDFMVRVVSPQKNDVILDPACGTAGFLISAYKYILNENSNGRSLTFKEKEKLSQNIVGYDISPEMERMSLANLYLHGFKNPSIFEYDTLTSEERWNDKADVILANPPFMSPKGGIVPHSKFSIKANRSEILFVDYIATHLTPNGKAGVIVPEGIIFQSNNAYKELRKNLVKDYLYAVISLPAGIFQPYSGVKTSILLFDKNLSKISDSILFIKIENDGFSLGAQRKPIDNNDLPEAEKIVLEYKEHLAGLKKFKKDKYKNVLLVKKKEIEGEGDFNLSMDRYRVEEVRNTDYPLFKIEELIERFEYPNKVKKEDYKEFGKYPIIDQSKEYVSGYSDNKEFIIKVKEPLILFGDHTRVFKYVDFDFILGADGIKVLKPKSSINPKYFYSVLNNLNIKSNGYSRHYKFLKDIQIPLPPIEVQEEIVREIEGYQKIIDGAKQVVENYKPIIKINPSWKMVKLGEVLVLEYGKPLKEENRLKGTYPVYGSNGIVGYHNDFIVKAPFLIIGRKGSAGKVHYSNQNGYPIDTTFYINLKNSKNLNILFLFYFLSNYDLGKINTQSGVPGINRNDVYKVSIPLPSLEEQEKIVAEIEADQQVIEANKQLIKRYEQKIKDKISEVWGD